MDAAVGHRVERPKRRSRASRSSPVGHVPAEQVLDRHRLRELGGAAPAAVARRRTTLAIPAVGRVEQRPASARRRREPPRSCCCLTRPLDEPRARVLDLVALLAPRPADAVEHLAERRHPVARLVREVGAAVERPAVGRQEDAHRPAAAAGHRLDGAHVDLVEVGPLLAVHLDRDEVGVQGLGRRLVLERLALHDVAPVARRVADRQEDRAVEASSPARAPRGPTGTSRPGCGRAGAGTGWSRRRGGWAWRMVPPGVPPVDPDGEE